jgi:hypothetical protein
MTEPRPETVEQTPERDAMNGVPLGVLSIAELKQWAEQDERVIRNQHPPDGHLGAVAETALSRWPADSPINTLRRWAYIKHLFLSRSEGLQEQAGKNVAQEAARQLLRREPVVVQIGPHKVEVTSRSYSAMAEIAQHAIRIRELQTDAERAEELEQYCLDSIRRNPEKAGKYRRRLKRVGRIHAAIVAEVELQRRAVYAHALTKDGAPAKSLTEAPAWVEQIDAMWDGALIIAIQEAGAGRYFRLGEPPDPPASKGTPRQPAENFGWASHFAQIERDLKVQPASFYDVDLYQQITWMRLAKPVMEEEAEQEALT